jgi:hypothetical protein
MKGTDKSIEMAKAWMLTARLAGPDRTATEDATASVYNFTAKLL